MTASVALWALIAVATDTAYYSDSAASKSFRALFAALRKAPVITTYNNVLYNTQASNLAQHGLHPHYQHILINLPQLLGPALVLLMKSIPACTSSKLKAMLSNPRLTSAATGTLMLSVIPHQESRFLLPCIPLLLTCVTLPTTPKGRNLFWISWAIFNMIFGILMGVYHQGGVIPTQLLVPSIISKSQLTMQSTASNAEVFWWKTYPPPTHLLGSNHINPITSTALNLSTTPLMGLNQKLLGGVLSERLPLCQPSLLDKIADALASNTQIDVYVAAPFSAWRFTEAEQLMISNFSFILNAGNRGEGELETGTKLKLSHLNTFRRHLNLDDMDFGDDGVIPTLSRVVGRRGLGVWRVERVCDGQAANP